MKKLFFIPIFCLSNTYAMHKDYITEYLPQDSLIRQRHEQTGRGFLIFKSDVRKSCDYINEVFEGMDQDKQKPANHGIGGVFGDALEILTLASNNDLMKNAIRTILADQSDTIKWDEYNKVSSAAYAIECNRKKRIEQQKIQLAEMKKKKSEERPF